MILKVHQSFKAFKFALIPKKKSYGLAYFAKTGQLTESKNFMVVRQEINEGPRYDNLHKIQFNKYYLAVRGQCYKNIAVIFHGKLSP